MNGLFFAIVFVFQVVVSLSVFHRFGCLFMFDIHWLQRNYLVLSKLRERGCICMGMGMGMEGKKEGNGPFPMFFEFFYEASSQGLVV